MQIQFKKVRERLTENSLEGGEAMGVFPLNSALVTGEQNQQADCQPLPIPIVPLRVFRIVVGAPIVTNTQHRVGI